MNRAFITFSALIIFCCTFFSIILSPPRDKELNSEASEELREAKSGRSGALEALEMWTASRAYPNNDIPSDRYYRSFVEAKRKLKEPTRSPYGGYQWQFIGPMNLSGRTIALELNPINGNTLYAGSASGGLWRSYTGGIASDWERVNTGFPVLGVNAIAIDPTDTSTMYIGTGEVYRYEGAVGGTVIRTTRGSYGMGILKTTDAGKTWVKSLDWSYNQQRGVQAIKINPLNTKTIWAATTEGALKSTDGGSTWTTKIDFLFAMDILLHPTDTNNVIVSTGNFGYGAGVFRTTDGGDNWDFLMLPYFTGKTTLGLCKSQPNTVYASVADSTTPVCTIWRSDDFGLNWSQVADVGGTIGVQGWYSHYVAVHPNDPNMFVSGAVAMVKSTDGGESFITSGGTYSDNHTYAIHPINPNILYDANDDGIYRSTNFGSNFTSVDYGYATGQFYNGFSNSTTDSLLSIGQVQDHIPGYKYTGNLAWTRSAIDEVGWTAITPGNDNIMFAVYRDGGAVYRSTNRGTSFSNVSSFGGVGCWSAPIAVSQSNPSVVYFAKDKIYKSASSGASSTWSATNSNTVLDGNPALSLAIAPSNENYVYVGTAPRFTAAHIYRTTNGGTSWQNVTGTLPNRYPNDIAVDPSDPNIAYVAYGGFNGGHFYKTTNGGSSWSDISGTLPDVPGTAVMVDPLNSATIYAGNDIGVYISTDAGASWNSFSYGLPDAILISDLTYSPSNRTLRVATHGNGVFERKLPTSFPAVSLNAPLGGEFWEGLSTERIEWTPIMISQVRLEYSTDNGSSWIMIADSLSALTSEYDWKIPAINASNILVKISAVENPAVYDISDEGVTIYFIGSAITTISNWNLISTPVTPFNATIDNIFTNALSMAFRFSNGYVQTDTLLPGTGYWLKCSSAESVPVAGDTLRNDTIEVHAGWNLIGSLTSPISTSSVSSIPPGIVESFYYGYHQGYIISSTLESGKGYWVKTTSSGSLILSSEMAKQNFNPVSTLQEHYNIIRLSSSNSGSQSLYFGEKQNETDVAKFALPPAPPAGIFSARFTTQRCLETVAGNETKELRLELSSVEFPVTLTWNMQANQSNQWSLRANGKSIALSGSGMATFASEREIKDMRLEYTGTNAELPLQTQLLPNYPNPFNPSTTIRYTIGSESNVNVIIYNALGQQVKVLHKGMQPAGTYSTEWKAEDATSGIYFARLTANGVVFTQKMLLMK